MARQQFRRYIWLIDTISSAAGITYEEISRKWERSSLNEDGDSLPKRTFFDHLNAIRDEFDIDIQCDRRDNTYRIGDDYDEYGSVKRTLIDALVLNNAVREEPDLNNSIIFNDNFHQESLPMLVRAIRERRAIDFKYVRDYSSFRKMQENMGISMEEWKPDNVRNYEFEPYGLYFSTLWFAVGRIISDGKIHIYALHRIKDIEILDRRYTVPVDFDVKRYMSDYWMDEEEMEEEREPDDAIALEGFEAGKGLDLTL